MKIQKDGPETDFRKATDVSQKTIRPRRGESFSGELVCGLAGEFDLCTFVYLPTQMSQVYMQQ